MRAVIPEQNELMDNNAEQLLNSIRSVELNNNFVLRPLVIIEDPPEKLKVFYQNIEQLTTRSMSVKDWCRKFLPEKQDDEIFITFLETIRFNQMVDIQHIFITAESYLIDEEIRSTGVLPFYKEFALTRILYGSITFETKTTISSKLEWKRKSPIGFISK